MFTSSLGQSSGPLEAQVFPPGGPAGISMLVISTKDREAEVTFFRKGPLALEQILDLGYEIVNAARKLMPAPPSDPVPEHEFVPYAINDAIEHDEAMASMPDCYDPDNDDRPNLVVHP